MCSMENGFVTDNTDCDDNNDTIHPEAPEVCNDKSDDCDGDIDENIGLTQYLDLDDDGFGNGDVSIRKLYNIRRIRFK